MADLVWRGGVELHERRRTRSLTVAPQDQDDPRDDRDALVAQVVALEEEVAVLVRRLQDGPRRVRTLEERLLETKGQLAQAVSQNEKLTYTLREARDRIDALRDEVDKLTQPPNNYATLLGPNGDGTVDVQASGRKMRVHVAPSVDLDELVAGSEVVLYESLIVVLVSGPESAGETVTIPEGLEGGRRALVVGRADEERGIRSRVLWDRSESLKRKGAVGAPAAPAGGLSARGAKLDAVGLAAVVCVEAFAATVLTAGASSTFAEIARAFRRCGRRAAGGDGAGGQRMSG
jgi:hypothetical protein